MQRVDKISRRSLIKLMILTSPALGRPISLLAEAVPKSTTNRDTRDYQSPSRPRLFYNSASLERLRNSFGTDDEAYEGLKKSGEELLSAEFISESIAMSGRGQQQNYGAPGDQMSEMGLTLGLLYQLT